MKHELGDDQLGGIKVDENLMTDKEGVFAGDDSTSSGSTVVQARGERAATALIQGSIGVCATAGRI